MCFTLPSISLSTFRKKKKKSAVVVTVTLTPSCLYSLAWQTAASHRSPSPRWRCRASRTAAASRWSSPTKAVRCLRRTRMQLVGTRDQIGLHSRKHERQRLHKFSTDTPVSQNIWPRADPQVSSRRVSSSRPSAWPTSSNTSRRWNVDKATASRRNTRWTSTPSQILIFLFFQIKKIFWMTLQWWSTS